ncbi:MAG: S1 RNA-binding domain-containing protein, partial [Candidatus Margulisiibacteriota bacterium]
KSLRVTTVHTVSVTEKVIDQPAPQVETESIHVPVPISTPPPPAPLASVITPAPDKEDDGDEYSFSLKNYNEGDIIPGILLGIEKAGVFVDIGYKCEGFVSNEELGETNKSSLKVGDQVMLFILQLETREGYTLLSKRLADWELAWKEAYQLYKMKEVVEVIVENMVKGGLVVRYQGLRGFIPSSLVSRSHSDQLSDLVGQKIPACFVEVDKKRKKIIFSNKTPDRQNDSISRSSAFDSLEVGQVISGRVTSIKDFGAFVNINGIEGLVHISELSWDRIDRVEDVLKVGDVMDVFILGIDKENRKVSLGLKQLTPDPWEKVEEVYPLNSIANGVVSRITSFGAFVKLEHGLEGLVHISELSHNHIHHVEDIVKIGDHVRVKVLRVIPEEQKIGLSIKQLADVQSEEDASQDESVDEVSTPELEVNE